MYLRGLFFSISVSSFWNIFLSSINTFQGYFFLSGQSIVINGHVFHICFVTLFISAQVIN